MRIIPNIKVSTIENNGTKEQIGSVAYFDKNGNGILDQIEADTFNSSKITMDKRQLSISGKSGFVDKFESIGEKHPESYYSAGSIPVAVIDDFTTGEDGHGVRHGTNVCNILKQNNPELAITKFNNNPVSCYGPIQKNAVKIFEKFPKAEEFIYTHSVTSKIVDKIFPQNLVIKSVTKALDDLKSNIDSGKQYKAVNMSMGFDCSYEQINKLVSKDLGIVLTPDNIAQYKSEIKEALQNKQNGKISSYDSGDDKFNSKISSLLNIIKSMEGLNIPIYLGGAYKAEDFTKETFNILSLADNAKTVEAGVQQGDKIVFGDKVSRNSFGIDENGKRRMYDSLFYDGSFGCLDRGSTSFATPMALANDLL